MSPLTRPTSSQSLATQPAVMDEYADAIEALKELPAGIARTQDYTAFGDFVVNVADVITGWSGTDLSVAAAVDATVFAEGSTASVKATMKGWSTTGKFYYDAPSAVSRTQGGNTHRYLSLQLRWDIVEGSNPYDHAKIVVAAGTALSGSKVEVAFPSLPIRQFCPLKIDISALSSIRSVGVQQYDSGFQSQAFWRYNVWIDDIRFKGMSEKDRALESGSSVGVIISPTFVPAQPEVNSPVPDASKTVVDLRPGKQFITGLNGEIDIRQFGLDETGATDVSKDLSCILTYLPEGSTLVFPADATYRVDYQLDLQHKNNYTLDGRGCTLFSSRRRGYLQAGLSGSDFFFQISGHNITIKNFRMFGEGLEHFTYGKDMRPLITGGGTPTVSGNAMILDALGETIRLHSEQELGDGPATGAFYSRDRNLTWKFIFNLSQAGTPPADDCELIIRAEMPGGELYGRTLFRKTLTLTATATDYEWVVTPTEQDIRERVYVMVRKKSAGNAISVHHVRDRGRVIAGTVGQGTLLYPELAAQQFDSNTAGVFINGAADWRSGIKSSNILIENCHIEGVGNEGVWTIARPAEAIQNVTVRDCYFRGSLRQGVAFDSGTDILMENCKIFQCGHNSIDIEPTLRGEMNKRTTIRNCVADGNRFGVIAAVLWFRIEDLVIENLFVPRTGHTLIEGGGRRARFSNITCIESDWDWHTGTLSEVPMNCNIRGKDVVVTNLVTRNTFRLNNHDANYDSGYYEDFGSPLTVAWTAGTTTMSVEDLSTFPAATPTIPESGRIAYFPDNEFIFTYTGKSAASGPGTLTGVAGGVGGPWAIGTMIIPAYWVTADDAIVNGLLVRGGSPSVTVGRVTETIGPPSHPDPGSLRNQAIGVVTGTSPFQIMGQAPTAAPTSGLRVTFGGTGTPEGVVTARPGSLFLRTDGGASQALYVKETGTGNTGWVAK